MGQNLNSLNHKETEKIQQKVIQAILKIGPWMPSPENGMQLLLVSSSLLIKLKNFTRSSIEIWHNISSYIALVKRVLSSLFFLFTILKRSFGWAFRI